MRELTFPSWGLIVDTKPDVLRRFFAQNYPHLEKGDVSFLEGTQGHSVYLHFPPDEPNEGAATEFARLGHQVSILDFHDEAPSVQDWVGDRFDFRGGEHPATAAQEVGVVVPGFSPKGTRTTRHAYFLEGQSTKYAKEVVGTARAEIIERPDGVAIIGPELDIYEYAEMSDFTAWAFDYKPESEAFRVYRYPPDGDESVFATVPAKIDRDLPKLASIRGESTPDAILRAFGIPPERILGDA